MRLLLCVAFLLAGSVTAHADPVREPSTLCEQAIRRAEAVGRTPLGMLAAVGQVESGRQDPKTGETRPWPWAIDADGVGQFFATKAQAVAVVAALQAQGAAWCRDQRCERNGPNPFRGQTMRT
jgi:hypothetical protein